MAYGISATGVNGIFQLNSDLNSTAHFAVSSQGSTTGSNGQIAGYSTGDLVVARLTSGSGYMQSRFDLSPPQFASPTTYKILKEQTSSTATNLNGSTYGIQVKNASGAVIFDSRSFANGFGVKTIYQKNAFSGGFNEAGAVPTGNIVYTSTSSADYASTFVSVTGSTGTLNQYYFDSSTGTGRILFSSYINAGGFMGIGTLAFQNISEILVGDFI